MIELAKHIEFLLLENDCVILPGFGGFVAHYTEATYEAKNQLFMPPMRTIGFNPLLRLNDGLLTQSVMEVYGTNYGDALKMVTRWVNQLKRQLYEEGSVELSNVGQLRMSIRGTMDFVPFNSRLTTSWLYGLGSFELPELNKQSLTEGSVRRPKPVVVAPSLKPAVAAQHTQRHSFRRRAVTLMKESQWTPRVKELLPRLTPAMMQGAAAVVAALVLFFIFSVPVKNTEVMGSGNYAQLMPSELFERIEKQSVAIHEVALPQESKEKKPVVVERTTLSKGKELKKPAAASKPAATAKPAAASKPAATKPSATASTAKPAAASKPAAAKPSATASTAKPAAASKPATKPSATASTAKPAAASKPAADGDYHVIVASVATEADARAMAEQLVAQGYGQAKVILRDGKNRVSLHSLSSQAAAYHAVSQLREKGQFAGAWVLHCKVK